MQVFSSHPLASFLQKELAPIAILLAVVSLQLRRGSARDVIPLQSCTSTEVHRRGSAECSSDISMLVDLV